VLKIGRDEQRKRHLRIKGERGWGGNGHGGRSHGGGQRGPGGRNGEKKTFSEIKKNGHGFTEFENSVLSVTLEPIFFPGHKAKVKLPRPSHN